jgi:HEAT repeat protein
VRIFDSKPDIAKMLANGDVENLARTVEIGGPNFDHDENTRREAVNALGSLADQRAVAPLIGALQDENERVRLNAVAALKRHEAFDPLVNAMHVNDSGVRRAAAEALGQLGNPRAVLPLIAAIGFSSEHITKRHVRA